MISNSTFIYNNNKPKIKHSLIITLIWFGYWLIVNYIYIFHGGYFLGYSSIFFFFCFIIIIISYIIKNGCTFKIGLFFYSLYTLAIVSYDFLSIFLIWLNNDYYKNDFAKTFHIYYPEVEKDNDDSLPFLGIFVYKIFITICFIIVIITQIICCIFLIYENKIFNEYESYKKINKNQDNYTPI